MKTIPNYGTKVSGRPLIAVHALVLHYILCDLHTETPKLKPGVFNPHPCMWGPCGPRKNLSGAYSVIIGIPEKTVYLIVHNTEPFHRITNSSYFAIGLPANR